jgi:HAD superfamily hydrolase (TIGR01549 family)
VLRAVLFDLDGTLLGNDIRSFLKPYFGLLTASLQDLAPAETIVQEVLAATQAVITHSDPEVTNQQAFLDRFLPAIGLNREQAMPRFDSFYEVEFRKLRPLTRRLPEARAAVELAFARGYKVVIATNPVFPRNAIEQRLDWAGVGDLPYDLVTTYENMHSCKPHPAYFREIAERLGCDPSECLMVGNEPDDMAAAAVGMSTFLVTDGSLGGGPLPPADNRGTLTDLLQIIEVAR